MRTIDGVYKFEESNTVNAIIENAVIDKAVITDLELKTPLAVNYGGTGETSLTVVTVGKATNIDGGTAGSIVTQTAPGTTNFIPIGVNDTFLRSNGTTASFEPVTVNNLPGGTAGAVPYQSAPGTTTFATPSAQGQILRMSSATLPQWFLPVKPIYTVLATTGGGTFIPASTTRYLRVILIGGGGGGGGGNSDSGGYGGGGAGAWEGYIDSAASIPYSIGAGGAGGTSNSSAAATTAGIAGSSTWIVNTNIYRATGGLGGPSTVVETNEPALPGSYIGASLGVGMKGEAGGVPIENGTNKYSGAGGSSPFFGSNGARFNTIFTPANVYGVGGSGGTATLANGQPGHQGAILIHEFAY